MRESRRSWSRSRAHGRRSRLGVAALTAAVLAGGSALTGCDVLGPASDATKRASPSPRPTPVWNRSPASVAAVGDSITRGFDACVVLADCPEVSWSTGTDSEVRSLALRLLGAPAVTEHSWNLAVSGARMSDLPGQMIQAARRGPELVTVMVGANDACQDSAKQMTPVADFRTSFELSMRRLRAGAPRAQVYVSSVPDLKRLWSTGRGNPLGRQIWKLGICATMLGNSQDMSKRAQSRRALVYDRVVAYNGVLKDVCAKDRRCRYDGGAVFDYRFTGAQLSHWDWFHPSKNGQGRLAEIAYRNVTAARPPS
ncbi:SGNH/GDSL hydrolase family protein [Streptomyces sp. AK02-01A]|uniref:SGNH/GDSL hydrolase family protein n=1 Tax=Streptomyces sp. AK02-01A TaxID=3028648 RepID=UPI0029B819E4|nr:SGNH/GDSL hydrolase family protein [Streptomyces sp. AK02-01A]MDX3849689.1 GDSL-type esterase/lipase family protein [Streptomyces sp. AK02-01A]MDX3849741.1 GDSL-type esterase/lipase family protein [Streptomyces sp. AK02-01A]